jgi:hypothetical protein
LRVYGKNASSDIADFGTAKIKPLRIKIRVWIFSSNESCSRGKNLLKI